MSDKPRSSRLYRATIASAFRDGKSKTLDIDTGDAQTRDYYGTTAKTIAHVVAGDYCDSGSVTVARVGAPSDRATIARRAVG